jgi:Rrf2 family protein
MTGEFGLAVHALVYLSRMRDTVCSEMLAKTVCTNPARVRKVMARLKTAGLIAAKEGPDGGYTMRLRPEDITLDMVLDALEMRLICPVLRSGDTDLQCVIASGMAKVMDNLIDDLNQGCRERLRALSIQDIDAQIPSMPKKAQIAPEEPFVPLAFVK